MKKGFTLAEVLITLGIIGVVAALTMPTLIKKYQQMVLVNRLKAAYSTINNALEFAKADYGTDINSWDIVCETERDCSDYFAEKYLIPYIKIVKDDGYDTLQCKKTRSTTYELTGRILELSNGTMLLARTTVENGLNRHFIYIFTGKEKLLGKDLFAVVLGGSTGTLNMNKNKFLPYGYVTPVTDTMIERLSANCNETTRNYCFAKIVYNNWKIPDDYPW